MANIQFILIWIYNGCTLNSNTLKIRMVELYGDVIYKRKMLNLAKPQYPLMMHNRLCRLICFFTSLKFCMFRFMHKSSTKWKGAYLTEAPSRLLPYIFCYLVSAFQITLMQGDRVNNGSRKIRKRNAEADQAKCIVISWSLEIYIIDAQYQCLELILCHELSTKRTVKFNLDIFDSHCYIKYHTITSSSLRTNK